MTPRKTEKATFAAGCFWGVEADFRKMKGVLSAESGYIGGKLDKPTYEDICTGTTGHAEAVQIEFDPSQVSYETLLMAFFSMHDPTTLNRQGPDVGSQYRSAVFYHNDRQKTAASLFKEKLNESGKEGKTVVTQIEPASTFYRAEEYHQDYFRKCGRT